MVYEQEAGRLTLPKNKRTSKKTNKQKTSRETVLRKYMSMRLLYVEEKYLPQHLLFCAVLQLLV